ncbi:MAG: hypothetical protein JRJ87_09530 [Deltaproteobacteria bacterium]|nr:hypothetical protein [Deltaproteobacteria bacterium]
MDTSVPSLAPSRSRASLPVIIGGLITTGLALLGVWAANQSSDDFNIMSWYAYYIIPIGALLIGIVAGSGYGIASWLTGVRISSTLLLTVVVLQILAYFAAQYIEYLQLLSVYGAEGQMSFFEYFDITTRAFAWQSKDGSAGSTLGGWGYLWRCLEIAGFTFGGLIVPLFLKAKPYCSDCQRYMRTRNLILLPAGIVPKKIKKKDFDGRADYERDSESAFVEGIQIFENLKAAAAEGQTSKFNDIISTYAPDKKTIAKLNTRITVILSNCPACYVGLLRAASLTGQGDKISRQDLGSSKVDPGLAREVS